MKKIIVASIILLPVFAAAQTYGDNSYPAGSNASAISSNQINSAQSQSVQSLGLGGEGGNANSDSIAISGDSGAIANISTNTTSNYETRTPPIAMFPPYLPTFSHGGWGTIQAYFPNGPNGDDKMYERAFYPNSKYDMKELKGSIDAIPYEGPLSLVGGILNCVGTLFGGPDNFHHGRGFEIANSVVRRRRPEGRPLFILIDSDISRDYLNTTGYIYVGKISLEGTVKRNWDQVYEATIAEALPWDIDIILVSGGMKGVTVGTNLTFPGIAGAYSQANYSVSLLGGNATGVTEGKGKAMVSAECYRYYPRVAKSREIPEAFYERLHTKTNTVSKAQPSEIPSNTNVVYKEKEPVKIENPTRKETAPKVNAAQKAEKSPTANNNQVTVSTAKGQQAYIGVHVSQELYEMAGFGSQQMDYMSIK